MSSQEFEGMIVHAYVRGNGVLVTVKNSTGCYEYILDPVDIVGLKIRGTHHIKRIKNWISSLDNVSYDRKDIPTMLGLDPTLDSILAERLKRSNPCQQDTTDGSQKEIITSASVDQTGQTPMAGPVTFCVPVVKS